MIHEYSDHATKLYKNVVDRLLSIEMSVWKNEKIEKNKINSLIKNVLSLKIEIKNWKEYAELDPLNKEKIKRKNIKKWLNSLGPSIDKAVKRIHKIGIDDIIKKGMFTPHVKKFPTFKKNETGTPKELFIIIDENEERERFRQNLEDFTNNLPDDDKANVIPALKHLNN